MNYYSPAPFLGAGNEYTVLVAMTLGAENAEVDARKFSGTLQANVLEALKPIRRIVFDGPAGTSILTSLPAG
jgi:hypothetical protein